jgi:hypothetical protein
VISPHLIRIQRTRQEGPAPESSITCVNLGSCAEEAYKVKASSRGPESSTTCVNFGLCAEEKPVFEPSSSLGCNAVISP